MAKWLGIDYGSKRLGLALSDEGAVLAFPDRIVENSDAALLQIKDLAEKENIAGIVIGQSLNFAGRPNPIMSAIEQFAEVLRAFGRPVYFEKEFLTSVEARRYEDAGRADAKAAALILQRFLDRQNKQHVS